MVSFAMLIGRALESASAPALLLHLLVRLSPRPAWPTDESQEHINIGRRRIASGWS